MANTFCKLLTNGYTFTLNPNRDLVVSPCCLYYEKKSLEDFIKTSSDRGLIVDWTKNCERCSILERSGQQSLRQTSADWIKNIDDNSPAMIDINLDYDCNAACVTCNENLSSLWGKENQKLINIPVKMEKYNDKIDAAIEHISNSVNLDKVVYIKFFGGEPLFTDTHIKFLEKISNPELITLHYTTNGSIYPNERVRSLWKRFKVVIFAASLDGIEEQFNYVRWPLKWEKVSENLLKIRESDMYNIMFRIEFTANFLNSFYYDRLENWITKNLSTNKAGDLTEINIHPCRNSQFNLEFMPEEVKTMVYEKLGTTHIISSMIKNCLVKDYDLSGWRSFVDTWDNRRNTDWKIAFPDLVGKI